MKNTPFTHLHIGLGAKMAEFAGYNMPISYTGINDEHHAVRNQVGVFDVSHMGEFILKGADALDLIQRVTSNDAARLVEGQAQYSCFTNEQGGIVDDLIVYCLTPNQSYMLVVKSSRRRKCNYQCYRIYRSRRRRNLFRRSGRCGRYHLECIDGGRKIARN